MTPEEKIELVLYCMREYSNFLRFCKNRTSCHGCVYFVTDLCSVMEPSDFIILLGQYVGAIDYKRIMNKLKDR
jgi:hypothetical protein